MAAEYFKRKITDLLVTNKPLPFYNEVNKIAGNIGSTQSQGVEITLNTVNIVTKDFEWDTTLTLSHYNDRWLKRDPNWKPRAYEKKMTRYGHGGNMKQSVSCNRERRHRMPRKIWFRE